MVNAIDANAHAVACDYERGRKDMKAEFDLWVEEMLKLNRERGQGVWMPTRRPEA